MSNVEVKLTTRESNKKIVLSNQHRPADGMSWVVCGLLLLLENMGPEGFNRKTFNIWTQRYIKSERRIMYSLP
jgi:hypothetical protein